MLERWRRRRAEQDRAHLLYCALVERARHPVFYERLGVPDSVDGRFEMIALHAFLVLRRLRRDDAPTGLGQVLFDLMFADLDRGLREMGVGDLSVGKEVKRMARAFYGRAAAYDDGLAGGDLVAALQRNVYGTLDEAPDASAVAAMARYVADAAATLTAQTADEIVAGRPNFGSPPAEAAALAT